MISTINPYNQKEIAQFEFLSDDALKLQLNLIENCYQEWKNVEIKNRKELGNKLNNLLTLEKENLADLISSEMGKPIKEANAEVEKCKLLVSYIIDNCELFLDDKKLDNHTYISYSPTGAIFGIMPWNYPLWQIFRYAFPNIIAGNIAILKHAPNTFGCAKAVENLFLKAGFPKNVFTNLVIDIPQVEQIIAHKNTQGVCVTGSTKAGSAVAALAGKHLKKSVLELGGTDAAIFFNDADFETALTDTFNSRMMNAGQVCIAPKRIFVPKNKLDFVIDFFKEKINQIVLGDPSDTNTTMGPISKSEFLPVLDNQVKKAIELGAQLITGGNIKHPFFEPTLLIVNNNNEILKEEIFGPVLCLVSYTDEKDLLEEVNNTNYGLGTAIWTADLKKATQWAQQIEAGFVTINKIVRSDVKYPFGGIKNSGYGKELGEAGFKTFLNAKTISM